MKSSEINGEIYKTADEYSSEFNYSLKETAVILAAGHGKRIKSQTSKMLHKIWEVPTVERVYDACKTGIPNLNLIIVVGIKAGDVIKVIGKRENTQFAYQAEQNGTGHAVQIALEKINPKKYEGTVFVLPGDMGLINSRTMEMFKKEFVKSKRDMMVLTGLYDGDPNNNQYGRIIRAKDKDINGKSSEKEKGKVIEIMEFKDILNLDDSKEYIKQFNGKKYSFTKDELLRNNEFNSGVFAFKYKHLVKHIGKIENKNIQKEIYITDLIALFNRAGLSVGAVSPKQQHVIMGFNNKSVLKKMEEIARGLAYESLKDIIEIEDPDDFFVDDSVIKEILDQDKKGIPLDVKVGAGAYIGKGVKLNYNLTVKRQAHIEGNVDLGKNVTIGENVHLSCYENQELKIGSNTEIMSGDIIKGNVTIGENCSIESSVNMTGSDDFPLRIGNNVTIKGTSYLFGSQLGNNLFIEHSVLIKKKVVNSPGGDKVQKIRFYLPKPEGIDVIEDIG